MWTVEFATTNDGITIRCSVGSSDRTSGVGDKTKNLAVLSIVVLTLGRGDHVGATTLLIAVSYMCHNTPSFAIVA